MYELFDIICNNNFKIFFEFCRKKKVKLLEMPADEEEEPPPDEDEEEEKPKKTRNKYKSLVQHDEVSSTTTPTSTDSKVKGLKSHIGLYKPRSYQLIKTGQLWTEKEVCFMVFT